MILIKYDPQVAEWILRNAGVDRGYLREYQGIFPKDREKELRGLGSMVVYDDELSGLLAANRVFR